MSKEQIKYGVGRNSVSDEALEEYLITHTGIKSKYVKTIQELVREGLLDMTVVHAIFATSMEKDKQQQLFRRHVNKIQNLKAGKDYDGIDITYDMEDLSKVKFWDRLKRSEVNLKEKSEIHRNAVIAKQEKLGKMQGEYEPFKTKTEKVLRGLKLKPLRIWLKGKLLKTKPGKKMLSRKIKQIPENTEAHIIAKEYNKMAYDKDGNKVTIEDAFNAFRERVNASRKLDKNNKNRLSEDQEIGVYQLIEKHTDPVAQKPKEDCEEDSDRSDEEIEI